jgi:hypothetical protein
VYKRQGNIIQQIAGGAGAGGGAGGVAQQTGILGGTLGPKIKNALGIGAGGGLLGGGGGGLGNALGMAGIGALAASLGKLAYEDTKNMKGVPITPMTAMGPTGRFNIEAEIARRMGQEAPNPVEFGLLPRGTIPELSGGKPLDESATILPINAAYGGEVRGVPMQVLRPVAVPSMMPLPPAPINFEIPDNYNFEIPENYLAAKDAMSENIETPVGLSPDGAPLLPAPPPSSPLAADGTPYVSPLLLEQLQATTDPFGGADEGLNPQLHTEFFGAEPFPTQPASPTIDPYTEFFGAEPFPTQPASPTIDPYMGQGGPSPEQLEKLRIDQEAWSKNPMRFSSEPYWLNQFWYKPQGWQFDKTLWERPTRPDTPTVGPSGKPFPIPPRRPMDADRPRSPRFDPNVGQPPPRIGRPMPLGPSDRPMSVGGMRKIAGGRSDLMRLPEPVGTPSPRFNTAGFGTPMPSIPLGPSDRPEFQQAQGTPMRLNPDGTPYVSPLPSASPSVPLGRSVRPPRIGTPMPSIPLGPSDKPERGNKGSPPDVLSLYNAVMPAQGTPEPIREVRPPRIGTPPPSFDPNVGQPLEPLHPPMSAEIEAKISGYSPSKQEMIRIMQLPENEREAALWAKKMRDRAAEQQIQQAQQGRGLLPAGIPISQPVLPMPNIPERPIGGLSSITEKIRRRPRGMNMGGMAQMARRSVPPILGSGYGPYVSMPNARGFANGGTVAMQDFQPMNGHINGIGTETSDEIPAMLSDGEFVMTGRGVRGAGSYVMQKNQGGIINLVPSLGEDRERGTQLMYGLMDEFGSRVNA